VPSSHTRALMPPGNAFDTVPPGRSSRTSHTLSYKCGSSH
jgi:hypothetical protein